MPVWRQRASANYAWRKMEESQLVHYYGASRNFGGGSFMKITSAVIVGSMLVVSGSAVYAQGGAQASSSASSSTSVQADKSGASASSNNSGSTSAHAGQRSASLASGTAMNAALSQPVDAKKNKPGDQVTAKTTEATKSDGKVVIPRGTKLIGHVTECKQRSRLRPVLSAARICLPAAELWAQLARAAVAPSAVCARRLAAQPVQ